MLSQKEDFLLDPDVIFLNHGSFGACPRSVFDVYQAWHARLEQQPVLFLGRELAQLQKQARQALGAFLNANADDLIFVPNATHGVNIIAHSLELKPGDEILTTDHEYGACDNTWNFICKKTGARVIHAAFPLPIQSPEAFVEQLFAAVTPKTRLIYLSHITSPTAQRFPVEAVCERARAAGIMSFIDGAHAPGQIPVDLQVIAADFYTGNAHKWMLSPKGAAFLYTRREMQERIEPLVVSWGYSADATTTTGSHYVDLLQWTGTHDPAAALSVPAAIQFMVERDWKQVRQSCNTLLRQALECVNQLTGLQPAYAADQNLMPPFLPAQLGVARLPRLPDMTVLKNRLYDEFHIEVPLIDWNEQHFVRISVQAYNTRDDIDHLVDALQVLLPQLLA
jgi:isopenicillin-N epimerase